MKNDGCHRYNNAYLTEYNRIDKKLSIQIDSMNFSGNEFNEVIIEKIREVKLSDLLD